ARLKSQEGLVTRVPNHLTNAQNVRDSCNSSLRIRGFGTVSDALSHSLRLARALMRCRDAGPTCCPIRQEYSILGRFMKEQYIAAKERWAQKMAGKNRPPVGSQDRLPPGQRQVHNL